MLKYTFSSIFLLQLTEATCKIDFGNLAFFFKCDIVIIIILIIAIRQLKFKEHVSCLVLMKWFLSLNNRL